MRHNQIVLVFLLAGVLSISGCFWVSRYEVLERVQSALPNVEITPDVFEVNSDCFLTSFDVHDALTTEQVLESSALASFRQLGKQWIEVPSLFQLLENPDDRLSPQIARGISGAILLAKPCLDVAGLTLNKIEHQPIVLTFTPDGEDVLFFFREDMTKFYYFVWD